MGGCTSKLGADLGDHVTHLLDLRGIVKMCLVAFIVCHKAFPTRQRNIIMVIFLFDMVSFEIAIGRKAPHVQMSTIPVNTL